MTETRIPTDGGAGPLVTMLEGTLGAWQGEGTDLAAPAYTFCVCMASEPEPGAETLTGRGTAAGRTVPAC